MSAKQWLKLDRRNFEGEGVTESGAEHVRMYHSIYDVPQLVRGFFDEESLEFVVQFKYIAPEQTKTQEIQPGLAVSVGRNSGRIFEIRVSQGRESEPIEGFCEVVEALSKSRNHRAMAKPNYLVAKSVINKERHRLTAELAH